jgi:BirA family biotin operon repressor/biotin-[acetyl-CoA-carboxylase] ligase
MSVVLRLPLPPSRLPPLTLAIGVATVEATARFEVAGGLKWPNDLLIDGKKAGGILTEAAGEAVIAGIGVNVNCVDFPSELSATSLALARGRAVDRALFAAALCERLEHWVERFVDDGAPAVMAAWRSSSVTLGRRVTAGGVTGLAEDVEPDGRLRLRLDNGSVILVASGEVS